MRLIFANSNTIGSWLIRKVTFGKWSHVGILDESNGYVLEASWPRGVVLTPIEKFKEKHSAIKTCSVYIKNEANAFKWAYSQVGKPYDTLGILGIWLHRKWDREDKWWCSEFAAAAMIAGGTTLIDTDMSRVTPQNLWDIPTLKGKDDGD